jgi:hypothetical protein
MVKTIKNDPKPYLLFKMIAREANPEPLNFFYVQLVTLHSTKLAFYHILKSYIFPND